MSPILIPFPLTVNYLIISTMILPMQGIISRIGKILRRFPGQRTSPQGRHLPQGAGTSLSPLFPSEATPSAITRHFSRFSLRNRTFIWRGGISTCWNGFLKQFPCTSTWSGASLTSSYTRCTRTPPPIPGAAVRDGKKIKLKHIRLWNEKKIQYSVTRFSNIIQDLLDAGVNTYFVYPKYEILQESVTLLLQEIHLENHCTEPERHHGLKPAVFRRRLCHGSPASKDPDASAPLTSRSRQLSQKPASPYPMRTAFLTALSAMDLDCITSQALAAAPAYYPPQRQPPPWQAFRHWYFPGAGTAAVLYKGRPEKIYQFHPELIS